MPATRHRPPDAFTLLEVLIVLAIIGVLAGLMIPNTDSGVYTRLQAAATVCGRDVDYARELAVTNSDNYKITFDLVNNRWILTHSGTNTALDALPITPLHRASDPANQQITALDALANFGGAARLFAVWSMTNPPQAVTDVEMLPVGGTTRTESTLVWLSAGAGSNTRYISVRINPTTGLFWVENYQSTMPTTAGYSGS